MKLLKKKQLYTEKKSGFSFIELILSVFILGLLSAIVLVNFLGGRTAKTLEAEARALSGVVREAQQYALSGKQLAVSQFPCWYEVRGVSSTSYETVMYYHTDSTTCADAASSSLGTYLITSSVSLVSPTFSVAFQVPFGSVSGTTNIALQRDDQYHAVCIADNGNISDVSGSACP